MNGIFYTGVVENRQDPTRLGRCQVRVVGLHTENKTELPTDLLPWAFPMQPVTSAAMNGIGFSPLGPVEGTWVVIFFRDQECQQPIMMGTIGGIPQDKEIDSNYLNDGNDYLIKTDGGITDAATGETTLEPGSGSTTPEKAAVNPDTDEYIGTLTEDEISRYKDAVAKLETTSEPGGIVDFTIKGVVGQQNYGVVNAQGRVGKYQFTAQALAALGYVKRVLNANGESVAPSNYKLSDDTIWTGKQGATGAGAFLTSVATQESAMDAWTKYNYVEIKRLGLVDDKTDHKIVLGYLHASHPDGANRAQALKAGQDIDDGYGNTTTDLYKNGYASLEGDQPKTLPQNVPAGVDADAVPLGELKPDGTPSDGTKTDGGIVFGFKDPNKKYPLKEFLNEPDTNRLARNDNINNTVVGTKDATRTRKVPVAINNATWDQPESPYNAAYPFNHTYQSESGHVQEFDDTPENERIHFYHKRGTFLEWDANGSQVNKIVGDGYQIIDRNGFVYIKGSCNLTVDGVTNVLFRSAANIEVVGDATIVARNNVDMKVSGTMNLNVLEDLNIECQNFGLKTRNDAMIHTDHMFYATSTDDMNLYSNKKLFINSVDNLTMTTTGNLFIAADLTMNIKGKSNLNIQTVGEQSYSSAGNFMVFTDKNIALRSNVTMMRSFFRTDIVSVQAGVNIEGGPDVNINSGNATGLPNAGNEAVAPSTLARPDTTAGDFAGVAGGVKDLPDPAARITPVNSFFAHLSLPPRHLSGASQFESPEEGDPSAFIQKQKNKGAVPQNESESTVADTAPAVKPKQEGKIVACEAFAQVTEFPLSTKLSANFYLGDFIPGGGSGYICVASSPHKLMDQDGLTKAQIVCNLKALAENVLENVIKIVPKAEIMITSGYRQKGLVGAESKTSQHPKGQACDIVLKKFSRDRKKHFDLIKQIAAAVPHDQLIMEYQDPGTVWIHISYTNTGTNKAQQFTMNNHHKSGNGFTLLV